MIRMGFHVPGLKVAGIDGEKSFAEALGDGVKRCGGGGEDDDAGYFWNSFTGGHILMALAGFRKKALFSSLPYLYGLFSRL